jgi:mannose-6-phosphate isomerase-like protein (cupin superfamily)
MVIDASVALRASVGETGFAELHGHELFAPPLMWIEAGSGIHELKWRREIPAHVAEAAMSRLLEAPIAERRPRHLLERAWKIADELGWARRMRIARLDRAEPFVTKDGSEIRELAGVPSGNSMNQSLAEATVPPGGETEEHYHQASEEIYLFTSGSGRMKLGDEEAEVSAGDTVVIPPGTPHKLWNTGAEPLKLLCCCAPAYSHEDTFFT